MDLTNVLFALSFFAVRALPAWLGAHLGSARAQPPVSPQGAPGGSGRLDTHWGDKPLAAQHGRTRRPGSGRAGRPRLEVPLCLRTVVLGDQSRATAMWAPQCSRGVSAKRLPRRGSLCVTVQVLVYWAGVYHMLVHLRPSLLAPPYGCPAYVVNTICFFITAGACLNGYWMISIVQMATRGGEKKHKS